MRLQKNTKLIGQHAFLSPSTAHWLDYDEDKLRRVYFDRQAAALGDKLHAFAQQAIELGVKQADNGTTLSMYINDAIGFRMTPEFPLYYSDDCFGTSDAVGFRDNVLRIHDLKTGVSPAKMTQLKIYAGIFCWQYAMMPDTIRIILRIYQNDQIDELETDPMDILVVMQKIKRQAELIAYYKEED